jgi:hypothetical protein
MSVLFPLFRFVSFRFVSFRFVSFRFVCFGWYVTCHGTAHVYPSGHSVQLQAFTAMASTTSSDANGDDTKAATDVVAGRRNLKGSKHQKHDGGKHKHHRKKPAIAKLRKYAKTASKALATVLSDQSGDVGMFVSFEESALCRKKKKRDAGAGAGTGAGAGAGGEFEFVVEFAKFAAEVSVSAIDSAKELPGWVAQQLADTAGIGDIYPGEIATGSTGGTGGTGGPLLGESLGVQEVLVTFSPDSDSIDYDPDLVMGAYPLSAEESLENYGDVNGNGNDGPSGLSASQVAMVSAFAVAAVAAVAVAVVVVARRRKPQDADNIKPTHGSSAGSASKPDLSRP